MISTPTTCKCFQYSITILRQTYIRPLIVRRKCSFVFNFSRFLYQSANHDVNIVNTNKTLVNTKRSYLLFTERTLSSNILSNYRPKNRVKKYGTDATKELNESKWLTIPNVLTGFRLVLAPYIGYLVLHQDFTLAFGLFVLAGATDAIDGWIARNFKGQSSILGSYIDPLADKVLVSILTFTLTWVNIIPVPLCIVIIARDLMIMSTAAHFHYKHLESPKTLKRFFDFENSKVQMEPTQISKYNTFFQLGLVAFSISAPVFDLVNHPYLQMYWYFVASTTVLSGLSYVVKDKSSYFVK